MARTMEQGCFRRHEATAGCPAADPPARRPDVRRTPSSLMKWPDTPESMQCFSQRHAALGHVNGVRGPFLTCPLPAPEEAGSPTEPGRCHLHRPGGLLSHCPQLCREHTTYPRSPRTLTRAPPSTSPESSAGKSYTVTLLVYLSCPLAPASTRQRTESTRHSAGQVTESELLKDPDHAPPPLDGQRALCGASAPCKALLHSQDREALGCPKSSLRLPHAVTPPVISSRKTPARASNEPRTVQGLEDRALSYVDAFPLKIP